MEIDSEATAAFQRVRMIHVAFMGAVLVYILLPFQMSAVLDDREARLAGTELWLLRAALVALSVAGQATVAYVLAKPHRQRLSPGSSQGHESSVVAAATSRAILRLAFTEAIGVYGLLLFLVGDQFFDAVGFCAASLVIFAVRFPTRPNWARELERLNREIQSP